MVLKGEYSGLVSYNVGDIVLYPLNDRSYYLKAPADAGTPPSNSRYWQALDQVSDDMVHRCLDVADACYDYVNSMITPTKIMMKDSEDNEYEVTVDASGESPVLAVTAVVEEGDGEGGGEVVDNPAPAEPGAEPAEPGDGEGGAE